MTVTLVTMKNPCSACLITADLLSGLFEKMKADQECADIEWEIITLAHPRELKSVPGLEVEKLPAVLIEGEQITAGSVLHKRRLMDYIREYK